MNYWKEAVVAALDEAGLTATNEQIEKMYKVIETSHDLFGMAHGHDCIPNPIVEENKLLAKKLEEEREKIGCPTCRGRGSITENFGNRSSTSRCDICHGEGKVHPRNVRY